MRLNANRKSINTLRVFNLILFLQIVCSLNALGAEAAKNIFLILVSEQRSWEDFAFLAAVPAAAKLNMGKPIVIALNNFNSVNEDIRHYMKLYNPKGIYILAKGSQSIRIRKYTKGVEHLEVVTADEAACMVARRFWKKAEQVVLCAANDYESALVASALAGRLRVPLLYVDRDKGLSRKASEVIRVLSPQSVLFVGAKVVEKVGGLGLPMERLKDANAVIRWMETNNLSVDYLTAVNPHDWQKEGEHKLPLSAPLLAVERDGAVVLSTLWVSLFDGKTLGKWKSSGFGGDGEITVRNGVIHMEAGSDLTGITWQGEPLARINYEITLEAERVDGNDFFCGLTFPVGNASCTLIMGGWGGGVTGLSSLDGADASENETSQWINYENGRWYKISLRVTRKNISAWLDGKQIINANITGRKISIRPEVELSKPLGISCWQTTAAIRNIRLRKFRD